METQNPKEPAQKSSASSNKISLLILTVVIILCSSFFGAIFGFMGGSLGQYAFQKLAKKIPALSKLNTPTDSSANEVKQRIVEEDSAVISVVQKSAPAVVSIVISKNVSTSGGALTNPFGGDLFNQFFGGGGNTNKNPTPGATEKQTIGSGSGFIVSADGLVVTNKHVVSDLTADYTVITSDGKSHAAKVLARDPVNDVAVVKIDGDGYPTLDFGDSDALKIGQTAIAIGNSLGEFSNTVSKGIISGLKRNLTAGSGLGESEKLRDIIQTDAAINPGNSGGPLLNIDGQVIGINVAVAQGAQSVGFAIPSNQIKKAVDQVKTQGKITTPYIGVRYVPLDDQIQKDNNLPFNYGALILRGTKMTDLAVIPGSPADKAGLVENDIILEIDGTKIDENNLLGDLLAKHNIGDELILKVWHKGNTSSIKINLEERK